MPQPSEARTASSGSAVVSSAPYRFPVTGSQPLRDEAVPQHPPSPLVTRRAAFAYLSRTISVMFGSLMASPPFGSVFRVSIKNR